MTDELKKQLAQLYLQKGSLITQMEEMQQQLSIVNDQIPQVKNAIIQQSKEKENTDKSLKDTED